MKYLLTYFVYALLWLSVKTADAQDHPTLAIGAKAPEFNLPGTDGKTYTVSSFKAAKVLSIVFTCNHCPTAQAYESRVIELVKDYAPKAVAVVAISPNDPKSVALDELGYTDMGDSFDEMKLRAAERSYNFPYLYDGETQSVSRAYGPVATPHIFIFDENRVLRYQGRIDDVEKPTAKPNHTDARNAIDALLTGAAVATPQTKVFGCSVKWAEKSGWAVRSAAEWAKEPVSLELINETGLREMVKNSSDKLRLINVWATWCGPCVAEFADFITMNRMYRGRDFEFVSVSADNPDKKDKVLKFLQTKQSSVKNYLFSIDDKYKLIEAIDPKWQGALPYTILVEPGGKIVYARQGTIDVPAMKKRIVENRLIGRYY